jgi:hypothetical protein
MRAPERPLLRFLPVRRPPCKSKSREKRKGPWRAPESARCLDQDFSLRTIASRLVVPASLQDRTSICCLGLEEPSQMIEFVFSASPETIRRGLGMCSSPSRLSTGPGSLRVDESQYFAFPLWGEVLHCYLAVEHLDRHKVLLPAFDGKHVADHLPGNSQGGAIPISPFQFSRLAGC